ncbi:DNA-processing protein DprA [bacterium]|nr:DNA-processing protein DprA [bacterium]
MTHILSTDTQAILLLCGQFGNGSASVQPLTLSEFNKFEQWLADENLCLSDLIKTDSAQIIEKLRNSGFDAERFESLLSRGSALAIAVERWTQTGLWILGRNDEAYPSRLKERLQQKAPVVLYGAGNQSLLSRGGLAVVGSRDADEEALSFAQNVGEICAQQDIQIISGGARGVDQTAMLGALEQNGSSIGILSGNLAQEIVSEKSRMWIANDKLVLLSPSSPRAPFNIWNAMDRNKLIYVMADFALVVSAELDKGGTWQGALENVKNGWVPLFVRDDENAPKGNRGLIKRSGIAIEPNAFHPDMPIQNTLQNLAKAWDAARTPKTDENKQQSILWDKPEPNKKSRSKQKKKNT